MKQTKLLNQLTRRFTNVNESGLEEGSLENTLNKEVSLKNQREFIMFDQENEQPFAGNRFNENSSNDY